MAIVRAEAELEAAQAEHYERQHGPEVQFPRIILRTLTDIERDFSIDLHQISRSNGLEIA